MTFGAVAADHVQNRRNCGPMEGATHYGACGTRGDGPYIEMWLEIDAGKILRAAYRTHGCPSSVASASCLCALAIGRTVDVAKTITSQDLLLVLGGLPEGKEEYAVMAVRALQSTLPDS